MSLEGGVNVKEQEEESKTEMVAEYKTTHGKLQVFEWRN